MTRGRGFTMMRESEQGGPPLRVTAREASWDDARDAVRFSGEVRAWQGEDYVVADELEAENGGERLEGRGSVKTVIKSRRDDDEEVTLNQGKPPLLTNGPGGIRTLMKVALPRILSPLRLPVPPRARAWAHCRAGVRACR